MILLKSLSRIDDIVIGRQFVTLSRFWLPLGMRVVRFSLSAAGMDLQPNQMLKATKRSSLANCFASCNVIVSMPLAESRFVLLMAVRISGLVMGDNRVLLSPAIPVFLLTA